MIGEMLKYRVRAPYLLSALGSLTTLLRPVDEAAAILAALGAVAGLVVAAI